MDDLSQARHDLAMMQARYNADVARLEGELTTALAQQDETLEAELWSESVFGTFDGLVSVIGVIIGLLAETTTTIVLAAVGLAVASACGMAAGEWLSDNKDRGATHRAAVMGAATALGTMIPASPFFLFSKHVAVVTAAILAFCLAVGIGRVRNKGLLGYAQTLGTLAVAAGVSLFVGWLIPASVGG